MTNPDFREQIKTVLRSNNEKIKGRILIKIRFKVHHHPI